MAVSCGAIANDTRTAAPQQQSASGALHETRVHSSRTRTRYHSHSAGLAFELLQPSARRRDSSTSSSEIDLDLTDPDGAHCIYASKVWCKISAQYRENFVLKISANW